MKRVKVIKAKIRDLEREFPFNMIRPEMVVGIIETLYWVLDNRNVK